MWFKSFFWANSLADVAKERKPQHYSLRRCFHRPEVDTGDYYRLSLDTSES
jgi:hypothetical protein